jgi:hypothetical protein
MLCTVVAVTPADALVDSLVLCVFVASCAVVAVNVIVAVPSTLATLFVAFVSSQDSKSAGKAGAVVDDGDDVVAPMAMELTEVDEELSSDEEDDGVEDNDEMVWSGAFSGSKAVPCCTTVKSGTVQVLEHRVKESAAKAESADKAETKPRKRWFRRLNSKAKRCFRISAFMGLRSKVVRKQQHKHRQQVQEESSSSAVAKAASAAALPYAPVSETRPRKRVAFGAVHVQEYGVILGDNPSCKGGSPLSLDWAHTELKAYSLDALEQAKASSPPRPGMGPSDRMHRIAAVAGIALEDLQKQERKRSRKAMKETYAAGAASRPSDDNDDEVSEVSVSSKSLGSFQF